MSMIDEPATQEAPTQPMEVRVSSGEPSNLALVLSLICTTGGESLKLTTPTKPSAKTPERREWTFGRAASMDFNLGNSRRLSSHHFTIWIATPTPSQANQLGGDTSPPSVLIMDKSTNGTYINNARIVKNKSYLLVQGDEIALGVGVPEDEIRYIVSVPSSNAPSFALAGGNNILEDETSIRFNYDIRDDKILGQGAFATVKKAIDRKTGIAYAVKIISKRKVPSGTAVEREITILKKLQHPGVVALKEFFEDKDFYYLVMDYVTGGDLMDFVSAQGAIPEVASREIIMQVLRAVEYVHGMGVSHRDIKPDNILIAQDNPVCVKVTDFGLAKIAEGNTFLKTFCGTLAYLAPEVIAGKNQSGPNAIYSSQVDMWSIGCLAYVIMTGYLPFDGTTQEHLYNSIKRGEYHQGPLDNGKISQEGRDFIRALLNIDPMRRPSAKKAQHLSWMYVELNSDTESQVKSESEVESQIKSELEVESQSGKLEPEAESQVKLEPDTASINPTGIIAVENPVVEVEPVPEFNRPSTFDSVEMISEEEAKSGYESDRDNDEVQHAAELECSQRQENIRKANVHSDQDHSELSTKSGTNAAELLLSDGGHMSYTTANSPSVPMSALALTSGVRDFDDYGEIQYPTNTYMVLQTLKNSVPFKDVYITGRNFTFGRSDVNHVTVPDGRVSKIHCLIQRIPDPDPDSIKEQVWLFDNAANRCWVNRVAIGKGRKVLLQDGDEIFLFFDQNNNNVFLGFRVSLVNASDFLTRRQRNGVDEVIPINDPQTLAKLNTFSSGGNSSSSMSSRAARPIQMATAGAKRPFQPMHLNSQMASNGGHIVNDDPSLPSAKRHLSMVPR